jgi:para-nitrobenzyl esterase
VGLLMLAPSARGLFAQGVEQSGTAGFGLPPRSLAQNEARRGPGAGRWRAEASGPAGLRAASGPALLEAADGLKPPIDDESFIWLQAVVDGAVMPRAAGQTLAESGGSAASADHRQQRARTALFGGRSASGRGLGERRRRFGADQAGPLWPRPAGAARPIAVDGDVAFADRHRPHASVARPATWPRVRSGLGQRGLALPAGRRRAGQGAVGTARNCLRVRRTRGGPGPPAGLLANFARTGDPNGPGLPPWSQFGAARRIWPSPPRTPVPRRSRRRSAPLRRP